MVLDEVLSAMAVEVEPFSLCDMAPRGWLDMPKSPSASLHYVLSGAGALHIGTRRTHSIGEGDLILVPSGASHSIGARDGRFVSFATCQPARLGLTHHRAGANGDGQGLMVLCAHISPGLRGGRNGHRPSARTDYRKGRRRTPDPADPGRAGGTDAGVAGPDQGAAPLRHHRRVRRSAMRGEPGTGWLVALADRGLWTALAEVIAHPGKAHSVESLADRVEMSRARFAARFKDSFGTGPMQIVRDLRLQHAARLLMEGSAGVARVADLVGFSSRSHFSQAFEARYGVSPGKYGRGGGPDLAPTHAMDSTQP
ncbi:MAG: hypothetical protein B7Z02_03170 [Rhodobacterales bacterium 32-67-9]|nr:MAG: hypothetical protein B7Z02_03170 [Rhodobacterales bacterium 32-67-9]